MSTDEERPNFPGSRSDWTSKLEFVQPDIYDGIPVYRILDAKGKIIAPEEDPHVSSQSKVVNFLLLVLLLSINFCTYITLRYHILTLTNTEVDSYANISISARM